MPPEDSDNVPNVAASGMKPDEGNGLASEQSDFWTEAERNKDPQRWEAYKDKVSLIAAIGQAGHYKMMQAVEECMHVAESFKATPAKIVADVRKSVEERMAEKTALQSDEELTPKSCADLIANRLFDISDICADYPMDEIVMRFEEAVEKTNIKRSKKSSAANAVGVPL